MSLIFTYNSIENQQCTDMKKFTRVFYWILAGMFILANFGCEEEKQGKEELLTAHPWKFEKVETTSTNPDIQSATLFANGLLSAAGAVWTFYEDGTHTLTLTALEPPESDSGTWSLSSDGKILTMTMGDQEETEGSIQTLTSGRLVFSEEIWDDDLEEYYTSSNSWVK